MCSLAPCSMLLAPSSCSCSCSSPYYHNPCWLCVYRLDASRISPYWFQHDDVISRLSTTEQTKLKPMWMASLATARGSTRYFMILAAPQLMANRRGCRYQHGGKWGHMGTHCCLWHWPRVVTTWIASSPHGSCRGHMDYVMGTTAPM